MQSYLIPLDINYDDYTPFSPPWQDGDLTWKTDSEGTEEKWSPKTIGNMLNDYPFLLELIEDSEDYPY